MTLTTLVLGGRASMREAAIAVAVDVQLGTALILEGMPDGCSTLDALADHAKLHIARVAPGCLCCTGNLIMRVTLNRILRHPPERLFISLATPAHIDGIRAFLSQAPYDKLLTVTKDMQV